MKLSQLAREIPEVADWQRRLAELLATTHAHPDGQTRREILAVHIPRLYVASLSWHPDLHGSHLPFCARRRLLFA